MEYFRERRLIAGQQVDLICSNTRLDKSKIDSNIKLTADRYPEEGDLVLLQVVWNEGSYNELEDLEGRVYNVANGDIICCVMAHRESGKCIVGHVPTKQVLHAGDLLHVYATGGLAGVCDHAPRYFGEPIRCQLLGFLMRYNQVLNTKQFSPPWPLSLEKSKPIILVSGTATDVGKTTLTSHIIRKMRKVFNLKVGACKAVGTGCLEDVLLMSQAGADIVRDFPSFGLPSTYTSPERFLGGIRALFSSFANNDVDIVIAETGGDIIWGNIPTLLFTPDLQQHIIAMVLVTSDVLSILGAEQYLKEGKLPFPVYMCNSPFKNVFATRLRLKEYTPTLQVFDLEADLNILASNLYADFERRKREFE